MFQEIKFLSQFKHENIVQYYGSDTVSPYGNLIKYVHCHDLFWSCFWIVQFEDRFYIYLEYVHPGSINKYVKQHYGAMTESVVRNFTRHILRGLAFLHGQKIMHRCVQISILVYYFFVATSSISLTPTAVCVQYFTYPSFGLNIHFNMDKLSFLSLFWHVLSNCVLLTSQASSSLSPILLLLQKIIIFMQIIYPFNCYFAACKSWRTSN